MTDDVGVALRRPSIAVYDAFWSTLGGGEAYAGGIAEVMRAEGDVTLIAHGPVDLAELGERLDLDLAGVRVRVIDECASLEDATGEFDLLFNASYRSHGRNGASRGVYVVYFPERPGGSSSRLQIRAIRIGRRLFGGRPDGVRLVEGFHPPDLVRWQQADWTNGHAVIEFDPVAAGTRRIDLWVGRFLIDGDSRPIRVIVDGRTERVTDLRRPQAKAGLLEPLRMAITVGSDEVTRIELVSDSSAPHDATGNGDRRTLGVPIVGITTGRRVRNALLGRCSILRSDVLDDSWLGTYDHIVSISEFTRGWIRSWWDVDSTVLEPPVALRRSGEKGNAILAVGRFFAPGRGHSKKQLEMVQAFRRLVDGGLAGWELHLVGGCSSEDAAYLDDVRDAADGLPVSIHSNATGAELDSLYAEASIFWHATGLGEDIAADPVRAEHFGITTVEAMSAGAVPVVIAAGGQTEIVTHGIDGFLFDDLDGLVASTRRLVDDPALRRILSAAAVIRAASYGRAAFAERLRDLLAGA